MLTFEGDPLAAEYLLDEWPESLPYMAHASNPTIPVFVVSAVGAPWGLTRRWMWSDRCLSNDRLSIVGARSAAERRLLFER
jgi:hypothetical protein